MTQGAADGGLSFDAETVEERQVLGADIDARGGFGFLSGDGALLKLEPKRQFPHQVRVWGRRGDG